MIGELPAFLSDKLLIGNERSVSSNVFNLYPVIEHHSSDQKTTMAIDRVLFRAHQGNSQPSLRTTFNACYSSPEVLGLGNQIIPDMAILVVELGRFRPTTKCFAFMDIG